MYRVGFGDCFLVSLPGADRDHYILVDCGVHVRGDINTMGAAVDDIATVTGKRVDIVIATHAHQDHISGFGTFASKFAAFDVGEVWMPWTEDPSDPTAAKLKGRQQALVGKLTHHFAALNDPRFGAAQSALLNLASNQDAFKLLRSGFHNATVKYYKAGAELMNPAGIAGLTVEVLGPPTDTAFLAKMDPPAGQRYLRASGSGQATVDGVTPFERHWNATKGDPGPRLSDPQRRELRAIVDNPVSSLAFALDQAINNTSLVTLFRYRGKSLLFPGDAQYGNWKAWMDGTAADGILSAVDFYKVAHHGSVNATPKNALEKMPSKTLAAMVSTQSEPWPSIPEPKLMEALDRKAQRGVVRSDSLTVPSGKAPKGPPLGTLPTGFSTGSIWIDYVIPVGP
jgi:hypothetical protein